MTKLSTNALREQRINTLFEWLYTFKFTDYDIAFKITDQKPNGGYRFIRRLIDDGFLVRFNNLYLGKQRNLLSLTSKGVNYLKAYGKGGYSAGSIRLKRYKVSITLIHDLLLQKAVHKLIEVNLVSRDLVKIVWEKEIDAIRIDALVGVFPTKRVTYDDKYEAIAAIELERSEKSKKRTDYLFKQHDKNLANGKYTQVFFFFDDPVILETYRRRFDENWADYSMEADKKTKIRKLVKKAESYVPQYKDRFKFTILYD